MIPLIRPGAPDFLEAMRIFDHFHKPGILTNFGPVHEMLVQKLNDLTGGFALPVANGTSAIEIGLLASGLPVGSRVAVPDFTHSGTIQAIRRAGMEPVIFGVQLDTWTLNMNEVYKAHSNGIIDGAVVVSPFGYYVNVKAWDELRQDTGIGLVFDFAGAFTSFPKTLSPVCYSFHATKNFGIGEGGMVLFASESQYKLARRLSNFDTLPDRSIASINGGNHKIDEIKAAFLLALLRPENRRQVYERVSAKCVLLDYYRGQLPDAYIPGGVKHPSLCVLGNLPAEAMENASETVGVCFKRYYPLLSRMPTLSEVEVYSQSDEVMINCVALPSDVDMTEARKVVATVKDFL